MAEDLAHVRTSLNYLADTAEKPAVYLYTPEPGTPQRTTQTTRHEMAIQDGREILGELSLDEQGFALERCESAVANFYDAAEVRSVYYPEVERLVAEATGASKVVAFDHNVRCAPMAKRGENGAQMPVRFAHNDYTESSGPQRVRDLMDPAEVDTLLENRFAVINVWKPIRGPVRETPLAVCDARSIKPQELVPTDLNYRDRTGEVYSMAFSPDHRWFYFPKMQKSEAILIKCYDSAADGRARFTAHTAFDDPSSPPDTDARESVEVRTLVFFAPDA